MKYSAFIKYSFFASVLGVFLLFSAFQIVHDWKIKNDYNIKFVHEDADGIFGKFSGKITFDENKPEAAGFDIAVDVKSVETGNPMRDESIVSDNWLSAEKYPNITFKAAGAKKVGDKWETTGTLFLRGVEKEITVPFTFKSTDDGGLFESTFSLAFIDYKMSDDAEEKITLQLKVPVSKD